MSEALIGYTGFVGGAILRHHSFEEHYRSTDIDHIRGRSFDRVVCCGAPGEKWRANQQPNADALQLEKLTLALGSITAQHVVLISTVDVYPVPVNVDERTPIDPQRQSAYGRHRFALEEFCRSKFDTTIVRLPGLYGSGLKKNAIFDLLHNRPVDTIPANARFQFYNVDRTWSDVERVVNANIPLVNINSEPVSAGTIAELIFHRSLPTSFSEGAAQYDVRSLYASTLGSSDHYWFTAEQTLAGIRDFVKRERGE